MTWPANMQRLVFVLHLLCLPMGHFSKEYRDKDKDAGMPRIKGLPLLCAIQNGLSHIHVHTSTYCGNNVFNVYSLSEV